MRTIGTTLLTMVLLLSFSANGTTWAQAPHRTRLILKDGSYQIVSSYKVSGDRVRFTSAERNGATEEIPLSLVDLPATKKWEQQHDPSQKQAGDGRGVSGIDPELLKEEADRAALTPEVANVPEGSLRLAPEDGVLALDTFHGAPELVPMVQQQSDLNRKTGHTVLKSVLNPQASSHQIVLLKGEKADVQLHVERPEIFVRVGDGSDPSDGAALTVDTHGASAAILREKTSGAESQYVIVRVDVRQDARVVASFDTSALGDTRRQQDVVDTEQTTLPGGHWIKVVPKQGLLFGEYCLVELLTDREINLGVWDFGIHPTAPENRDVLRPERKRAVQLERRRP